MNFTFTFHLLPFSSVSRNIRLSLLAPFACILSSCCISAQNTIIIIIFFYQLDAQIIYFCNTFITFLYLFRALLRSSSGGQIVLIQCLVSSLSLVDCSVHRLREESSLNLCTEQSPKERDDTRCCTNTV